MLAKKKVIARATGSKSENGVGKEHWVGRGKNGRGRGGGW